jgi:hypothetical protein
MTAYQIIRRAILKLGVTDPTQSLTSQEVADGLEMLNVMLAEWYTNSFLKQQDELTFTTDVSASSFSFGANPNGSCDECPPSQAHASNINPLNIISAFVVDGGGVVNNQIRVVNRIDTTQFNRSIVTNYPEYGSYQYGFQTSYFHLWPQCGNGVNIKIFYLKPHENIPESNIHVTIPMPPQYYMTLILDLANRLASDYGAILNQTDYKQLMDSKKDMEGLRSTPSPMARFDAGAATVGRTPKYPYIFGNGNGSYGGA